MSGSFKTNPVGLLDLMKLCEGGKLKLPDFQRGWVWDEARIIALLASISQAFPVGALMTLENGGEVEFYPRTVEGAPETAEQQTPDSFLLDGQQRMTSLFQATFRKHPVLTDVGKQKRQNRFYYIDIVKALDSFASREDAVIGVPQNRIVAEDFGRKIVLDVSSAENEYKQLHYPVNQVFDWDEWQDGFNDHWQDDEKKQLFRTFKTEVLEKFKSYQVPVIALDKSTTREAVCLVFEKVNTGGKPLDAFELVTAMFAAKGFRLRKDWETRQALLAQHSVLTKVQPVEFLQAITLRHTKSERDLAIASGLEPKPVSATKQSLLGLSLEAYQAHADAVQNAYIEAAKFLFGERIYKDRDIPYQTQLVPLAVIISHLGNSWQHDAARRKVRRWYWSGVLGELYGSTTETRFAKDVMEVPDWVSGSGALPTTVEDARFEEKRLRSMTSRLSAAYKGMHALLMASGARDLCSGQTIDASFFFDESIDVHHIFPRAWCEKAEVPWDKVDSIINKTPLAARTNRILGGVAPSQYLARLEKGWEGAPPIEVDNIDQYLASHRIDHKFVRNDDFHGFFDARRKALLELIEEAIGKAVIREDGAPVVDEDEGELIAATLDEEQL